MNFRFLQVLLTSVCVTLMSHAAFAAGVTLAWDANQESDIAGYRVHYGERPGEYNVALDAGTLTTFQINSLVEGRTYYFVVQAYSTDGLVSPFSSEVSTTVQPRQPDPRSQFTVTLSGDLHLSSPTLQWAAVTDAQAYYLYVGTAAGLNNVVNSGETQATSYTLPAMTYTQTFVARIYTKQAGQWRWSELSFKPATQLTEPLPRSEFTVTPGASGHIADRMLSWSTVADAQAYYLYVGTTPGATDIANSGETQALSYKLPVLPSNLPLFARIYTKQAGAWRYNTLSFKPMEQVVPARFITPATGQQNVTSAHSFQWDVVPQAQAYYLYVGTTAGGKNLIDTGELARTSYAAPSLPAGVHLFARIWTKMAGVWYWTAIEFDTAPKALLLYPAAGAPDASSAETFAWTRVTDATAYRLTVGTTAGGSDILDSGDTTTASRLVTGLAPGQALHAAIHTFVKGVWEVDAVTFNTAVSARFTRPTAGDGSDLGQGIAWTSILGATAYKVSVGTSLGASDLIDGAETSDTTMATPALPAGQPLFAQLRTNYNGVWTVQEAKMTLAGAALASPSADASSQTTIDRTAQLFTWTTITNAESYYLGIGTQPGAKDLLDTGELQATSYLASNLPVGRLLYVSVWTRIGGVWNVTSSTMTTK